MSLIPSESLNFPDSFRANVGWRLPKEAPEEPEAEPTPQWPSSSHEPTVTPKRPEAAPAPASQAKLVQPVASSAARPLITTKEVEHVSPPSPALPKIIPPAPVEAVAGAAVESIASVPVEQVASKPASPVAPEPVALKTSPADPPVEAAPVIFKPEMEQPELPTQASEQAAPNAAPPVSVSGPAAHALIAQIFQMRPPADAKIEPVRPESASKDEIVSAKPDAAESKSAEPVTKPLQPDTPVPEGKADHKSGFSLTSLPGDLPRHASATTPVPQSKPAPVESVRPSTSGSGQAPAENNHILELIAAAAQRGILVDVPAGEPRAAVRQEPIAPASPVAAPAPHPAAPQAQVEPAVSEKASTAQSPAAPAIDAPPSESAAAAKTPAKIRIQPRKIKPRAVVATPEPAPTDEVEPIHPTPQPKPEPEHLPEALEVAGSMSERPRPAWDLQPPGRLFEPWEAKMPPRKITAGRLDAPAEDFGGLFIARDRRNRWVGFSLCEAAALTGLILLLYFALTHKFADPTLKLLVFILAIAAAAVAVALPIAFIRNSPKRWDPR